MDFDFNLHLDAGRAARPALDPAAVLDLLVVGAGPAGLNAALYAARKGLSVGVLAKRRGGQVLDTSAVDNYIGLDGVDGEGLAAKFLAHLARYEVPVLDEAEVLGYRAEAPLHAVTLASGETYSARALVVATGSTPRRLGVPGEAAYAGKGVSYCAICDGPFFAGRDVFVAGGGNSAVQAALDLAQIARSVTLVHRSALRADKVLVDRLESHARIAVMLKTRIVEVLGTKSMEGLRVEDVDSGERKGLSGPGLFIEIGHLPNTGAFGPHLRLTDTGEIVVTPRMETSVPGLFAAGDVTDFPYKQIVIAASGGAVAALSANEYIQRHSTQTGLPKEERK
jgi:alkyl hydroperoxide reductase subunit F